MKWKNNEVGCTTSMLGEDGPKCDKERLGGNKNHDS